MGIVAWVVLGLALGLGSPFLFMQLQRRRDLARAGARGAEAMPAARRAQLARPRNPFAAVTIRPCAESPCAAVLKMHNTRYLAVRAPRLPVPGCDRANCGCGYVRHADRRTPGDRRDAFAQFGGYSPNLGNERRAPSVDRRKAR